MAPIIRYEAVGRDHQLAMLQVLKEIRTKLNLATAILGDPSLKKSLFYFHGIPGTKLEAKILDPIGTKLGVTIIAMDRPGYGDSPLRRERTLSNWAEDVGRAAKILNLRRFSCLGVSGGGPYALACGRYLSDSLHRVGVVSSVCSLTHPRLLKGVGVRNRLFFSLARYAPALLALTLRGFSALNSCAPRTLYWWQCLYASSLDRAILRRENLGALLSENFTRALAIGSKGVLNDLLLTLGPWDFSLSDIKSQVHLWHGEQDDYVSLEMGRQIASELQNCQTHFVKDGAHLLAIDRAREIVSELSLGL